MTGFLKHTVGTFFFHVRHRAAALALLAVLVPAAVRAQDPPADPFHGLAGADSISINLHETVMMALERNSTVTIQRLTPQIADTYYSQMRERFDPELTLSMTQNKTKLQRFLGTQPDPVPMTWDRSNYNLIISEDLPTGTNITATATMSGSISSLYTDQFSGIVGVTVTQSLLQGFGLGANMANLRKAEIDVEMSKHELKAVAEQVVANVEKAYWNLYLTGEEIAIQKQSLSLAEQQLRETMERVEVGKLSELELAAVYAETAIRRENLIDARSAQAQAQLRFVYLVNPPESKDGRIVPVPVDRPFVPSDSLDTIDVHEELGSMYRTDLLQSRLNLEKGNLDVVQTRNGLLPRLDFYMTFNRTTYSVTSLSDAAPDLQSPFHDINTGVTFQLPVAKRAARAEHTRSKATRRQREISVDNYERLVRMDVRSAYIEAVRAREQISATSEARILQEKNLEAELEKFRVGKSTNYLVLQAQRDFTASRRDEIRSMVMYLNALIDLYQVEGTLLDRRNIDTTSLR